MRRVISSRLLSDASSELAIFGSLMSRPAVPRPFRRAVVRFGRPIDPGRYRGGRRTRRRLITDDVMAAIQQLSGQRRRAG
jgi:hypothetical protein